MAVTYQDFEREAQNAGLLGQFSQADLDTAQRYPEFGMSILSLKQDYANATTDEGRLLANAAANNLRNSYANYTGGSNGAGYVSSGLLPTQRSNALDAIGSFGSFNYDTPKPTYANSYSATQQDLLNAITNREPFSWSKETDPLWPTYKKSYLREGDRATANALAQAAAASGGRVSSYAQTAATQAGDYYAAQLNDILPTLYRDAYNRYLAELQDRYNQLNAVNTLEQMDYNKYLNELSQFNTDRSFAKNVYDTDFNRATTYLQALQNEQNLRDAEDAQNFANALNLWNTYGYVPENYASTLGLPANTPTAEQAAYEYQLAQAAARLNGRGGGGGGSGLTSPPSDGLTAEQINAYNRFMNGDYSSSVLAILRSAGYSDADLSSYMASHPVVSSGYGNVIDNAMAMQDSRRYDDDQTQVANSILNYIGSAIRSGNISDREGNDILDKLHL